MKTHLCPKCECGIMINRYQDIPENPWMCLNCGYKEKYMFEETEPLTKESLEKALAEFGGKECEATDVMVTYEKEHGKIIEDVKEMKKLHRNIKTKEK